MTTPPVSTRLRTPAPAPERVSAPVRLARAVGGGFLGLLLGLGVSLGIVVSEARFENRYLESTDDILGGRALPIPAGLLAGAAAGWAAPALLAGGSAGGVVGGAVGALLGAGTGALASDERSGPWAGGVIGSGIGILLGITTGLLRARDRRRRRERSAGRGRTAGAAPLLLLACAAALAGCGGEAHPIPEVPPAPPVEGEEVQSVFLFFGDPGKARYLYFPIIPKLAQEVESWSARLERDSAVVAVALGDIIYPDGMHDPGDEGYPIDSARVESQIDIVRGERARERGARMYFVAGNHDWGLMEDRAGTRRLKNLGHFVARARARDGVHVELVPEAGTGMPYVVDLGSIRLLLLDTAWWIFDAEPHRKEEMVERLAEAVATAGERDVVVAAHHPYATAGPHGGEATLWKDLGIRRLLARSGAMLQSLDSRVYRDLNGALEEIFARVDRPLVFVGGHEHSQQVIRHDSAAAPRYSLVSGSASKVTPVGWTPGMLYRHSAPGYMRMVVRENGAVDLYVEAAPERYLVCPMEPADPEWRRCMEQGVEAYETVFSMRLREPAGVQQGAPGALSANPREAPIQPTAAQR